MFGREKLAEMYRSAIDSYNKIIQEYSPLKKELEVVMPLDEIDGAIKNLNLNAIELINSFSESERRCAMSRYNLLKKPFRGNIIAFLDRISDYNLLNDIEKQQKTFFEYCRLIKEYLEIHKLQPTLPGLI